MAHAQSLGAASAKEKQRRKGKEPAKVITEEDLRRAGGVVSSPGQVADTPAAAPVAPDGAPAEGEAARAAKPKTEEQQKAEQAAAWRKRLADAQQKVDRARAAVAFVQSDLADTSSGYYTSRRAAAANALPVRQQELAAAEQELQAVQDEGRRNGY
jgi:hypothetical protein